MFLKAHATCERQFTSRNERCCFLTQLMTVGSCVVYFLANIDSILKRSVDGERCIAKGLDGRNVDLITVISRNFCGGVQRKQRKCCDGW